MGSHQNLVRESGKASSCTCRTEITDTCVSRAECVGDSLTTDSPTSKYEAKHSGEENLIVWELIDATLFHYPMF